RPLIARCCKAVASAGSDDPSMAVGSVAPWWLRTRTINSQQTVKTTITAIFATRSAKGLPRGNLRFKSLNLFPTFFHGMRVEERTVFTAELTRAAAAEIRRVCTTVLASIYSGLFTHAVCQKSLPDRTICSGHPK